MIATYVNRACIGEEDRIRCSACGMWNDPQSRPTGGQFEPNSAIETYGGTNYYVPDDEAQGCWSCGCPEWDNGGSLGDMKR